MLKKNRIGLISFIISLFCFGITFASTIRIDQPKIRISVSAGGVKTDAIKVENVSDRPIAIKVYLEDWQYIPPFDGSKEFRPAGMMSLSCANWINFLPAEFTIPAFGRQMVNFTVNVPKNATGGHYAVMFFETQLGQAEQGEGVFVNVLGRIGSLFYVEAAGTISKVVNIENFLLSRTSNGLPLEIDADFHNVGNVDITAGGNYYIIDKAGMVYARGEFNEVYTLPDDTAKLRSSWKENIPKGSYDFVMTLDLGAGKSLVKEAAIEIGNNGEVIRVGQLK